VCKLIYGSLQSLNVKRTRRKSSVLTCQPPPKRNFRQIESGFARITCLALLFRHDAYTQAYFMRCRRTYTYPRPITPPWDFGSRALGSPRFPHSPAYPLPLSPPTDRSLVLFLPFSSLSLNEPTV
jgi:hypothetical protein